MKTTLLFFALCISTVATSQIKVELPKKPWSYYYAAFDDGSFVLTTDFFFKNIYKLKYFDAKGTLVKEAGFKSQSISDKWNFHNSHGAFGKVFTEIDSKNKVSYSLRIHSGKAVVTKIGVDLKPQRLIGKTEAFDHYFDKYVFGGSHDANCFSYVKSDGNPVWLIDTRFEKDNDKRKLVRIEFDAKSSIVNVHQFSKVFNKKEVNFAGIKDGVEYVIEAKNNGGNTKLTLYSIDGEELKESRTEEIKSPEGDLVFVDAIPTHFNTEDELYCAIGFGSVTTSGDDKTYRVKNYVLLSFNDDDMKAIQWKVPSKANAQGRIPLIHYKAQKGDRFLLKADYNGLMFDVNFDTGKASEVKYVGFNFEYTGSVPGGEEAWDFFGVYDQMSPEAVSTYGELLEETDALNKMKQGTGTLNYPVVLYSGSDYYVVNIANHTKKDVSKMIQQKLEEVWCEIYK